MTKVKTLSLRRLGSVSRDTKAIVQKGEQEEFVPILSYA